MTDINGMKIYDQMYKVDNLSQNAKIPNAENKSPPVTIQFIPDAQKPFKIDFISSAASLSLNRNEIYKGLTGCKKCMGTGMIRNSKSCKRCVMMTGNCPVCKNTGIIVDKPGKICNCIWGADRK